MTNLEQIRINNLRTAEGLKGKIKDILSPEEIHQLASEKRIPHYILSNPITGEEKFYFDRSQIDDWYALYYIKHSKPIYEQTLNFLTFDYNNHRIESSDNIPPELHKIKSLYKYPFNVHMTTPPCIYFLCTGEKIVYIGQSCDLIKRITTHLFEKEKVFTSVYFIPCPINNLLKIEGELIKQYKPQYNFNKVGERSAPCLLTDDVKILEVAENGAITTL